jgi:uncharacterized membrane protein YecN with MAPEG domain
MEPIVIVILLAGAQYMFFAAKVGQARARYGIKAPAISGNDHFERIFRVHQNTLEQLVVLTPAIWFFGVYVHVLGGAVAGFIYLVARQIYFNGYRQDPDKRALGFVPGYLAMAVLLLGGLGGAIWSLVK